MGLQCGRFRFGSNQVRNDAADAGESTFIKSPGGRRGDPEAQAPPFRRFYGIKGDGIFVSRDVHTGQTVL